MQSSKFKVPHFELNSIERIFIENRDKNIFHSPAKMKIPESNCAHHEDFGHLTNDCRNLYGQIMHIIKKGDCNSI